MPLNTQIEALATAIGLEIKSITPQLFQALKTTTQAVTTGYVDIGGWDTPTHEDAPFSFNVTTGELTISENGDYELSGRWVGVLTANNRSQAQIRATQGGVEIVGTEDINYAMRNATQNDGSAQFSNFLLSVTAAPVVITLQALRVGSTCNINLAQFTMKRIRT